MQTPRLRRATTAAGIGSVLLLTLMLGLALAGQQKPSPSSLKGVWRHVEITTTGPNGRTVKNPQPGLLILTDRYFSVTREPGEAPRRELPPPDKATDKDIAEAARGFVGQAGTYDVTGGELTYRYVVSLVPNQMRQGSFTTFTFKRDGDTLYLTQKATQTGPLANPTTFRYMRLE